MSGARAWAATGGYRDGPWTGEDAGPRRTAVVDGNFEPRFGGPAAPRPRAVSRHAPICNMPIVRGPDEVYLQGCTPPAPDTSAWVERVDPVTLEPIARTRDLPGGPYWAGGLAAHADGSLLVVHGRHAHCITPDCEVIASRALPQARPYNSFVLLPDGALVTKDIDLEARTRARLTVLAPGSIDPLSGEVEIPEPAIARLTADAEHVYVVGAFTVFRFLWDGRALVRDAKWSVRYRTEPTQSFGWDPVVAGGHLWWMDNGDGAASFAGRGTMRGAGVAPGPVHLWRASLDDPADVASVEISGLPHGFICNPPLYDERRDVVVGFDAGNGVIAAFTGATLEPRWRRELDHAGHLLLWPGEGALLAQDHTDVVVLDVASGDELSRTATDSLVQYVLFPAAGTRRDVYLCSPSTFTRVSWEDG